MFGAFATLPTLLYPYLAVTVTSLGVDSPREVKCSKDRVGIGSIAPQLE